MTALLASVRTADEAEIALAGGADVIDLKDPGAGALGRLSAAEVRAAVGRVAGRRPVSATIGDPPLSGAQIAARIAAMSGLGVDVVKVGIASRDAPALRALAGAARAGVAIVAVLLADRGLDLGVIERLAAAGATGVMLDTGAKDAGGLRRHVDADRLAAFADRVHAARLICGLAGSLERGDIAPLMEVGPDLLGFRGALCVAGRDSALDPARLAAIRAELGSVGYGAGAAMIASAVAGAQSAARARAAGVPATSSA